MGRLVGTLSTYEVLYHFRPSFLNYATHEINIDWNGIITPYIKQFKSLTVGQVMKPIHIVAAPDDHLIMVIDQMVKHNLRRLPVVKDSELQGIIFLPDAYYYLFNLFLRQNTSVTATVEMAPHRGG